MNTRDVVFCVQTHEQEYAALSVIAAGHNMTMMMMTPRDVELAHADGG